MSANATHSCMSALLLRWHVVLNSVLAAIIVVLPITTASWATRRFGGSSIGALLIAAVSMGVGAMWFLRELTHDQRLPLRDRVSAWRRQLLW
jgi:hypothetical protein